MAPQLRLDHVHYRASKSVDFERTRAFYVNIMGAQDLGTVDLGKEGERVPHLQLKLGGVLLLFAPSDTPEKNAVPASTRLGVYHIAFRVEDCDEATRYFAQRGATVAIAPFDAGDNIRASFLSAPDGMLVELKQDLG